MPRKKKSEKTYDRVGHTKRLVGLRLDESDYAALEAMAEAEGRSVANMASILFKAALASRKGK